MNQKTAHALNEINHAFYDRAAGEFSATREAPWPGWIRLLSLLERLHPAPELEVLDVGCGNGRFAAFLAENLPQRREKLRYLGIDASAEMLERAGAQRLPLGAAEYRCFDFVESRLTEALPERRFSLAVLFGVLHHVPGAERRQTLLADAVERLAPAGLLALTCWQFEAFERFRAKLVPWEQYNRRAAEPVELAQLEPGDHLVPWGRSGETVRYCHFSGEEEMLAILDRLPLELAETYEADGREGNLNRYFVLRRLADAPA